MHGPQDGCGDGGALVLARVRPFEETLITAYFDVGRLFPGNPALRKN